MKQWKFRSRNSKSVRYKDFSKDFRIDSARNAQINLNTHKLTTGSPNFESKTFIKANELPLTVDCENMSLVSFGSGKEGALGHGSVQDSEKIVRVLNFSSKTVSEVHCGAGNTIVLTCDNLLFSWGLNSVGQLGLGHFKNKSVPCRIDFDFGFITKISCGAGHCMVINTLGEVFSWGCAGFYQTCHGQLIHNPRPMKVDFFSNMIVSEVSCGISHSLLIADSWVYAVGDNSHYQCAGTESYYQYPHKLKLQNITKIAAGGGHSLFLDSNHTIYACGLNSSGQVGVAHKETVADFIEIRLTNAANVFAGEEISAYLTCDSKVFVWGWNGLGQLGQGHFGDITSPTLVQCRESIEKVALGVSAVALITKSKKLLLAGHIGNCLKSQLKKGMISLDYDLAKFNHVMDTAKVTCVGIGRTHCVAFIEEIQKISHSYSAEIDPQYSLINPSKNLPALTVGFESEPQVPEFFEDNPETRELNERMNKKQKYQEVFAKELKFPAINKRENSFEIAKQGKTSYDNPFKALLSVQKAKEEVHEVEKEFKITEKQPPLSSKPLSQDHIVLPEPKNKIKKIKSMERETSLGFLQAHQMTYNVSTINHQQRIKDLENLIARYDKKISSYHQPKSPKISDVKSTKRIGGGYVSYNYYK